MKNRVETRTLGEVCQTSSGGTPLKSRKKYYEGGTIPWLLSGEVAQGEVREARNFITTEGLANSSAKLFPENTVLVAMYGATAGQVGILRFEAATNQAVCGILPSKHFLPKFLFYFLLSRKDELVAQAAGNAQPNISQLKIRNTNIQLVPLPEQRRIVGILDEAFGGIATAKANAETNLQNARALFESHLQCVFTQRGPGWVEKTLGEVAQVKGGKRVPKGYKLLTEPTDYPYLRVTEFTDIGTIDTRDLRYVSPEVHRKIKNYVIFSTDLYISIAGTIGKTGIVSEELDGANLTENACRLVFSPGISNRFVYYFTVTPDFTEQAGLNTRTAAQPKLALSRLATIKLGIPPLAEQKRLAAEFDTLREETQRLESIYQRKCDLLEALKKSLLHQAFTGGL